MEMVAGAVLILAAVLLTAVEEASGVAAVTLALAAAASGKVTAATPESSSQMVEGTAARIETAPASIPVHDDLDAAPSDNRSRRRALLPG
jgi:hypothetical protein